MDPLTQIIEAVAKKVVSELIEQGAPMNTRIMREHREVSPDCTGRIWVVDREQDFAKGRKKRAA